MKTCKRCQQPKPPEEFTFHPKTRDRLQSWCRACFKTYRAPDRRKGEPLKEDLWKRTTGFEEALLPSKVNFPLPPMRRLHPWTPGMSVLCCLENRLFFEAARDRLWEKTPPSGCALCYNVYTEDFIEEERPTGLEGKMQCWRYCKSCWEWAQARRKAQFDPIRLLERLSVFDKPHSSGRANEYSDM